MKRVTVEKKMNISRQVITFLSKVASGSDRPTTAIIKAMAVILVANGQGLTAVSRPRTNAESTGMSLLSSLNLVRKNTNAEAFQQVFYKKIRAPPPVTPNSLQK